MSDNTLNAAPAQRTQLRKTLTLVPVVMMGLAYLQPMTLFDTFGIVSGLTDGHVATAYAFALIAILFTALSYGKLVTPLPVRGFCLHLRPESHQPARRLYGGLVIAAGLPVHADDQHPAGENLL